MSCNRDPATVAWNRALARFYGISPATLQHDNGHDISSQPSRNSIQLGKLYRTSDRRLKRQKVLHEFQHLTGKFAHDRRSRQLGYFSDPKRDKYTRELLPQVERAIGRERNPAEDVVYRGIASSQWANDGLPLPNRLGVIYASTDPDIARAVARWPTYTRDDHGKLIAIPSENILLSFRYKPSIKIADTTDRRLVTRIIKKAVSLDPDWQTLDYDWLESEMRAKLTKRMHQLEALDNAPIVRAIKTMGYDAVTDRQGTYAFLRPDVLMPMHKNPWFTFLPDRYKGSGGLQSYWITPDGGRKFYNDFPEGPPVHTDQAKQYLKDQGIWNRWYETQKKNGNWEILHDTMAKATNAIRVQAGDVELFTPPTEAQLERIASMAYRQGSIYWDIHDPAGKTISGSGSYDSFLKALKKARLAVLQNPWVNLSPATVQARAKKYPGKISSYWLKRDGRFAIFGPKDRYDITDEWPIHSQQVAKWIGAAPGDADFDDRMVEAVRREGVIRAEEGSNYELWEKPSESQMATMRRQFAAFGDTGGWDLWSGDKKVVSDFGTYADFHKALAFVYGAGKAVPRRGSVADWHSKGDLDVWSYYKNPHQLFSKEAVHALKRIADPYAAFKGSTETERKGLAWLSQHRVAWIDRDGFYHLNDRGMDAWLHASKDKIEMSPVPLFSKGRYAPAAPMAILGPRRRKSTPPPPVEFESDLPDAPANMTLAEKALRKVARVRKAR